MSRTIVLLDKNCTHVTNSAAALLDFPDTGLMPATIECEGITYNFMDQPTHESDHEGAELFRYCEDGADPAAIARAKAAVEAPAA